MSSNDSKQYGLILPKSKQNMAASVGSTKPSLPKSSVFGDESSSNSEDECSTDWMKKRLQAKAKSGPSTSAGHSGGMKKQTKVSQFTT